MGKLTKAAHAHTDLNTFHAVITLLEGGLLYGTKSKAAAKPIIAVCKREAARCLREYDAAIASGETS